VALAGEQDDGHRSPQPFRALDDDAGPEVLHDIHTTEAAFMVEAGPSTDGLRANLGSKLPPDTNAVERVLRGFAVGRKNHCGSRSERGTSVAALQRLLHAGEAGPAGR
jgi:hypothetical protein